MPGRAVFIAFRARQRDRHQERNIDGLPHARPLLGGGRNLGMCPDLGSQPHWEGHWGSLAWALMGNPTLNLGYQEDTLTNCALQPGRQVLLHTVLCPCYAAGGGPGAPSVAITCRAGVGPAMSPRRMREPPPPAHFSPPGTEAPSGRTGKLVGNARP